MRGFLVFFVFLRCITLAGFEKTEVGTRARALGGAYCGLSDDCWSIFYNVGGLAQVKHQEVSFLYSPQPFGLNELSVSAAAAVFTTNFGEIGVGGRRYGSDLYHELTGTIAYSNTVSGIGFGFNLNYHSVSIKNYGSAGTIGIDAGQSYSKNN